MFGKLMFWKKDSDEGLENLGLPKEEGVPTEELGLGSPGLPEQGAGLPSQEPPIGTFQDARIMPQQPQQPMMQQQAAYAQNKDLELISAKLDSLRAIMENMNQRISNIERIAYGEEESRRKEW